MRHTAIGFNFIDINHRTGRYPLELPTGIGSEAAGVIEAVGAGVKDLKVGQRVVYVGAVGTYAEAQNVSCSYLRADPLDITDEIAAATHLKGMTVEMLVERVGKVKKGDVVSDAFCVRRRWTVAVSVGQSPRRDRHRHSVVSVQMQGNPESRCQARHRHVERRTWSRRSPRSPRAQAST